MPANTWWKTVVALVALILLCRWVTPPRANVNVAFAMYPGAEKIFPSYLVYIITMIVLAAVYFLITQYVLRRWLAREPALKGGV